MVGSTLIVLKERIGKHPATVSTGPLSVERPSSNAGARSIFLWRVEQQVVLGEDNQ